MRRTSLSRAVAPWIVLMFSAVAASSTTSMGCSDTAPDASCAADSFDAQPRSRFPIGQTFYLPTSADQADCQGLAWELVEAPAGNQNQVVAGADGIARFTPH